MAVIDELDSLKDRASDQHVRWRAAHTLGVVDAEFRDPRAQPYLSAPQERYWQGTGVTAEILFDPPGHVRLPRTDAEIVDRLASAEPMAARKITLITYDTGMSLRAREAGLLCVKLPHPEQLEGEPTPPAPKQTNRTQPKERAPQSN